MRATRYTPEDLGWPAPNSDTLYYTIVSDLRREPQVLHLSAVSHRCCVAQVLDFATNNPTLIGVIIQAVAWPFAYLLTVLAAGVAFFLASKVQYTQRQPPQTAFDYAGGVLVFLSVVLLTIGIMQGGSGSLFSLAVLAPVGAGLALGAALVLSSRRKEHPLINFSVLGIRTVAVAVFISLMRFLPSVLMGAFVARYVQEVLGLSATVTGMLMIVPVLAQAVAAPIGGKMLDQGGGLLGYALRPDLLHALPRRRASAKAEHSLR